MESALIVCRFVHFAAVLLLFGGYLFRDLLFRTTLAVQRFRVTDQAGCWLAALALVSAVVWWGLIGASMAGSWAQGLKPDTLLLVLSDTSFGKVWRWHLLFSLLSLIALLAPTARWQTLHLPLAALLLITLAPVGHIAMFEGLYGQLLILNQVLHLSATGAWLGGLCGLLRVIARPQGIDLRTVLRRFSGMGYVLVALIIATGLINVRAMSGAVWPTPAFSGFGLILGIKVAMVIGMLALALCNRLMLNHPPLRVDILRISIGVECLFGLAALAAVSLLGTLPPMLAP